MHDSGEGVQVKKVAISTVFLALGAAASLAQQPQQDWQVRVLDLATGQGVPNTIVDARTSRTHGVTDADGLVVLQVLGNGKGEDVLAHGNSSYGYTAGHYSTGLPRTLWLVPNSMYHKTGVIPTAGTVAPIVFQGVTQSCFGPNPYTIEVEIPANVLPEPAEFWIVPVPAFAAPYPVGADAGVAAAAAQFTVELKDATGRDITKVLPEPGIVVRFSPTWYTYGQVAQHQGLVRATQYRLTRTSQSWDSQPDQCYYDPASGMFTAHLRACSWWVILPFVPFLTGDTRQPTPTTPRPPAPELEIILSDCAKSSLVSSTFVTCGVVSGGACTASIGNNGRVSFSAQAVAGITATLGLSASDFIGFLPRLSASLGGTVSANAQGGFDVSVEGVATGALNNGDSAGPNSTCYSGEASIGLWNKVYVLKYGSASVPLAIPQGIVKKYCLSRDGSCGEECGLWTPVKREVVLPKGLKVCPGDILDCH